MATPEFSPDAVVHQVEQFLRVKRPQEAHRLVLDALKQAPDSARLYTALGRVLSFLGKHNEAIAAVQKAIALDPTSEWAFRLYSAILLDTGNSQFLGRAREAALTALRLEPQSSRAHSNLFNVFMAMKAFDEAQKTSDELLALAPESADAFYCRAYLLSTQPDSNPLQVRKVLLETLKRDPEHVYAHFLLGQVLRLIGPERKVEGTRELRTAVDLNPGNAHYRNAYKAAAIEDARDFYGSQAINSYGQPVQFFSSSTWRPKRTRVRKRFADFSLKFLKTHEIKPPFYRQVLKTYEFNVDVQGHSEPFSWRGGFRTPSNARPLVIGGHSFAVELKRSELFEELDEDFMVVSDHDAPAAPGLWILFASLIWTPSILEKALSELPGVIDVQGNTLTISDGAQCVVMVCPPHQERMSDSSFDEEKMFLQAKALLEAPLYGRPLEFHYSGKEWAERIFDLLCRQMAIVRFVASDFNLRTPPTLERFGNGVPTAPETPAESMSLAQRWEKALSPAKKKSGDWFVLFGAFVSIEVWLEFAREAGAEVLNEKQGETRFMVQGHTVTARFMRRNPELVFIHSFQEMTGKPLRGVWRWEFDSLELAVAILRSANERWTCAAWENARLHDPALMETRLKPDMSLELADPGTLTLQPPADTNHTSLSVDILFTQAISLEEWRRFVAAHEGYVDYYSNEGRTAAWYKGSFTLSAEMDTFAHAMNGAKKIAESAALIIGAEPVGYINLASNDAEWAVQFLRWVQELQPVAVHSPEHYGQCLSVDAFAASLPTV